MSDTDPAEATVALPCVVADPGLWPREGLHQGRVEEFVLLYQDGGLDALPPLDVVPDGEELLLGDGWHRHQALTRLGSPTARVRLITEPGDPTAVAYRHGMLTASTAALPLTRPERRAAVIRLLEDQPELADREIARLAGVSPTTVGAHRKRLLEQSDVIGDGEVAEAACIAATSADELALRLARSLDRIFEARGLTDYVLGDRTGRRLAKALVELHGADKALLWARRLKTWSEFATAELGG